MNLDQSDKDIQSTYLKFLTPLAPNCESSWVQISLYTKKYKCII